MLSFKNFLQEVVSNKHNPKEVKYLTLSKRQSAVIIGFIQSHPNLYRKRKNKLAIVFSYEYIYLFIYGGLENAIKSIKIRYPIVPETQTFINNLIRRYGYD